VCWPPFAPWVQWARGGLGPAGSGPGGSAFNLAALALAPGLLGCLLGSVVGGPDPGTGAGSGSSAPRPYRRLPAGAEA
jgi:hypothetical protein